MTDRKKPGVAFWATVVVVVALVGYPLSFGPACWIATRYDSLRGFVNSIYHPAAWAYFKTPEIVGRAIIWYANVGGDVNFYGTEREGFRLAFELDIGHDSFPPPLPRSR
jgi:hypothetical protein